MVILFPNRGGDSSLIVFFSRSNVYFLLSFSANIRPSGQVSAQQVNTPILSNSGSIGHRSVTSLENVSNNTRLQTIASIRPSGITTAQVFGNPNLTRILNLLGLGIISIQAIGTHRLRTIASIQPSGKTSEESFGTHVLRTLTRIRPSGITTAQATGTHNLTRIVSLFGLGIVSGQTIGSHTLKTLAFIRPASQTSLETFGNVSLSGIISIRPSGIATGQLTGTHILYVQNFIRQIGLVTAQTISNVLNFSTESEQKQRKIIGCYSRAVLLTNDVVYCFMPYWEIEKVILASGEEHVYNFNEFIDYFNVNDSLKGFRKKLKPTLNGTFEATNDAEEFLNAIKQAAKADYFSEYVVLVLDNAAIHTKEMVRWLWMEHRVLVIFLPTRSPECNILN